MQQIFQKRPTVVSQLWRDLKAKINFKILKKGHTPWMRHKEIDVMGEVLDKLNPKKCFEWGSGFSTLYFPQMLGENTEWTSLEHNYEWYKTIQNLNHKTNVQINYVPPDNQALSEKQVKAAGTEGDFKAYINFPNGQEFDFIFIDGRARKACVEKAFELVSDRGVVILHDANRQRYHEPLKLYQYSLLLTDYHVGRGGIWIGSKSTPIDKLLDIKKHKKLWAIHYIIGKMVFKK